jgi:hypothetical protein
MKKNEQDLFKTQQQVIYYRAEVSKYKNRIEALKQELEKEAIRNRYLQTKIKELKQQHNTTYSLELEQLRKKVLELEVELEEEKALQETVQNLSIIEEKEPSLFSYFNYSILFPYEEETTLTVISDLTIVNIGVTELEEMIVCLKISPMENVVLSGRISNPKLLTNTGPDLPVADWIYATEDWKEKIRNTGEYWIRSYQKPNLSQGEQVTFQNFEILIDKNSTSSKITVEAFIYCKGMSPLPSKNKIILSL